MEVWDIKNGQGMTYDGSSLGLLKCFDPKKSLYLYEPGKSIEEPYFEGLKIPTLCSVSPDSRRYKEFQKNGGVKLYMPIWTLPELQAVRKFIADRNPEMMPLTEEDISGRFHDFGGIIRHVFSPDIDEVSKQQQRAIEDLDPKKVFLDDIDRGSKGVSHLVAQYNVTTEGPKAFRKANIDFVSVKVREAVEAQFLHLDFNDKIRMLMKNDVNPAFMASICPMHFEDVIAQRLIQGVEWERRNLPLLKLNLTEIVKGEPPAYADMEPGVLYKPSRSNYPAVDMMSKTEEGLLYGLQVTRLQDGTRKVKVSAVALWLKSIGLMDRMDLIRIAVIQKPDLAAKFKVEYEGDSKGYPQLEVWKVPLDYGRGSNISSNSQ